MREEGGFLVILDLENGQEIARHRISPGRGLVIKNTNLSADPPVRGGKGPSLSRYRALLEEEDREIHLRGGGAQI